MDPGIWIYGPVSSYNGSFSGAICCGQPPACNEPTVVLLVYTYYILYLSNMQLTLTLSQDLPMLLDNETYLCHFATGGNYFTVEAAGSGTTYACNITDSIPLWVQGLATGCLIAY